MKDNFKNTKAFFSKPLSEPIDDIEFMMVLRELEKAEKLDKREKASKWGRDTKYFNRSSLQTLGHFLEY